jgi:hypothetical protein
VEFREEKDMKIKGVIIRDMQGIRDREDKRTIVGVKIIKVLSMHI